MYTFDIYMNILYIVLALLLVNLVALIFFFVNYVQTRKQAKETGKLLTNLRADADTSNTLLNSYKSFFAELSGHPDMTERYAKAEKAFDEALATTINQSKEAIEQEQAKFMETYKESFNAAYKEYIDLLKKQTKDNDEMAKKLSQEFLNNLQQQTMATANQKDDYTKRELETIKTELQDYKTQQLANIEANIYEILARASEAVIGQAVSFDLHQDLIIKALEQAKREGVFV